MGMGPTHTDAEALAAARELGFFSAEELACSVALQASLDETGHAGGSEPAVSFARIAKLGYAATGPALSALGSPPPPVNTMPLGAWASRYAHYLIVTLSLPHYIDHGKRCTSQALCWIIRRCSRE